MPLLRFLTVNLLISCASSFQMQMSGGSSGTKIPTPSDRRAFLSIATTSAIIAGGALPALAGIDPSALSGFSVEGDQSGVATRARQIEMDKDRPEDKLDLPWENLDGGVKFREFREGKGAAVVQDGSKVAVQMTIRCKAFATTKEPGGLKYFSTKDDTEFDELAWQIGSGELPKELEEGMKGMHKNAIRRIEIPSTATFAAKKANQLPLPAKGNKDGNRRFENLFKTDATVIFEVLLSRVK